MKLILFRRNSIVGACCFLFLFGLSVLTNLEAAQVREMILIADFEGETYGEGWKTEGTAFGTGPAQGTLPVQMQVSGFEGKGLLNSFLGGDEPKGKLTSPVFTIQRNYLSFLLGGGGHKGLAINLVLDGKIVRSAAGPNHAPGGSERLQWHDWDVREFQGKQAHLEILDEIGGSWGHINVDHIIQTDRKKEPVMKTRDLSVTNEYLHIPISFGAPVTWVRVEVDGKWQQEFDCGLCLEGTPDFYATLKIGQWKGKTLTLIAEKVSEENRGLEMLKQSDELPMKETVYTEKYRPQFHYSARIGWINDPNGLLYHKGTWHLFTQHNPYGTAWGNMTWGHATSTDLLHWTDQDEAIHPDKLGTIFSGSGVVDHKNTSGFGNGNEPPIVLMFTYNGPSARFGAKATQGIAYSLDGGETFEKYEKNPVIDHIIGGNRDPKVIWYEPQQKWIMALYMDENDYAIFVSKNLKEWERLCDLTVPGCDECPDFFPLNVDGNEKNVKWVFWGANGRYLLGSFDGKDFKPETPVQRSIYGGNDYAAMTFSDVSDGRRIQLSWMRGGEYPGMPFNQQYTVPRELTLRTIPKGVRLFMEPVGELARLRMENPIEKRNFTVFADKSVTLSAFEGLVDSQWTIDLGTAEMLQLEIQGQKIRYNVKEKTISLEGITAPLDAPNGKLTLRLVLDRTSLELFAQDGEVQIAKCLLPKDVPAKPEFQLKTEGGQATLTQATIWKMRSIWKK